MFVTPASRATRRRPPTSIFSGTTRKILTAPTSYYVSGAGSDMTGDGSIGNPWLTLGHANAFLQNAIDFGNQQAALFLAPNFNYAGLSGPTGMGGYIGGGILNILGQGSGSTDYLNTVVFVGASGGNCFSNAFETETIINIDNLTMQPRITGTACIESFARCTLFTGGNFGVFPVRGAVGMDFSALPAGNFSGGFGAFSNSSFNLFAFNDIFVPVNAGSKINYMIAAAGPFFNQPGYSFVQSNVFWRSNGAFTLRLPWAFCEQDGSIVAGFDDFSLLGGAVTGQRFTVQLEGIIQTFGAGPNYFPGSSQGQILSGGQYL
jgi:hypothetical protein